MPDHAKNHPFRRWGVLSPDKVIHQRCGTVRGGESENLCRHVSVTPKDFSRPRSRPHSNSKYSEGNTICPSLCSP